MRTMGHDLGFQFLSLVSHTLYDIRRYVVHIGGVGARSVIHVMMKHVFVNLKGSYGFISNGSY